MNKTIVISQPMFLPWYGLFEQIKLSNIFVHYDDIQFPQGRSFTNRVQLKTANGIVWLTAPLSKASKADIKDMKFSENIYWRKKHLSTFTQAFSLCPYREIALNLLNSIYSHKTEFLCDFNIHAIEIICDFLKIKRDFYKSSNLPSNMRSTDRLVEIVSHFNGTKYVTGHGAKNYLEYNKFEDRNIEVDFIKYECNPYSQQHGQFTPYVTILDLIANKGEASEIFLTSQSINRRSFLNE
jgi:hypothetical protein